MSVNTLKAVIVSSKPRDIHKERNEKKFEIDPMESVDSFLFYQRLDSIFDYIRDEIDANNSSVTLELIKEDEVTSEGMK